MRARSRGQQGPPVGGDRIDGIGAGRRQRPAGRGHHRRMRSRVVARHPAVQHQRLRHRPSAGRLRPAGSASGREPAAATRRRQGHLAGFADPLGHLHYRVHGRSRRSPAPARPPPARSVSRLASQTAAIAATPASASPAARRRPRDRRCRPRGRRGSTVARARSISAVDTGTLAASAARLSVWASASASPSPAASPSRMRASSAGDPAVSRHRTPPPQALPGAPGRHAASSSGRRRHCGR